MHLQKQTNKHKVIKLEAVCLNKQHPQIPQSFKMQERKQVNSSQTKLITFTFMSIHLAEAFL